MSNRRHSLERRGMSNLPLLELLTDRLNVLGQVPVDEEPEDLPETGVATCLLAHGVGLGEAVVLGSYEGTAADIDARRATGKRNCMVLSIERRRF